MATSDTVSGGTVPVPSDVIEAHERALDALLSGPDPTILYAGGGGESEAEMIERMDAAHADQGIPSSASEARVRLLEEELAAAREQIRKIAANAGGLNIDHVARETSEADEDRKWDAIYTKIRKAGGYCTIIMHASEDPQRNQHVAVGINGHMVHLPRNIPFVVHVSVLEVLVRSRVHSVAPQLNERGERTWVPIRYQCYPFSLLDQGVPVKGKRGSLMMAAAA